MALIIIKDSHSDVYGAKYLYIIYCIELDETMFLVGTDEGLVYKCTTEYSSRFLQTYHAHNSPVYNICWNTYVTSVFLTCAAEWMIKIWDHKCP